eukprot:3643020-Rhodomonas_salina.2
MRRRCSSMRVQYLLVLPPRTAKYAPLVLTRCYRPSAVSPATRNLTGRSKTNTCGFGATAGPPSAAVRVCARWG